VLGQVRVRVMDVCAGADMGAIHHALAVTGDGWSVCLGFLGAMTCCHRADLFCSIQGKLGHRASSTEGTPPVAGLLFR